MNILIFGGQGQVGTELRRGPWPNDVDIHSPTRHEVDIASEGAMDALVASRPWACVINAAAYTAVDMAETHVAEAWRVNALAPALIATAAAKANVPLVHVSTDFVFSGHKDKPYEPEDAVGPLNVYGASKEGGEQAVRTAHSRHVVLRTAWVVSPHRSNFVKTMLRLASEKDSLRVVDDQRGCPTSATDLAAAIRQISLRLALDSSAPAGTYHFVNSGEATWCGFARAIMVDARRRGVRSIPVEAISTAEFKSAAKRPANSRLSTESLMRDYGVKPRHWEEALQDVLDTLHGGDLDSRTDARL